MAGKATGLLAQVREEIDPAKLWFADFEMLEVDEDAFSVGKRKQGAMTMDCFRKTWLQSPERKQQTLAENGNANGEADAARVANGSGSGKTTKWRRCARCTAVMEDLLSSKPALQWLVMQQRRCYCSGHWDYIAPGQMDS